MFSRKNILFMIMFIVPQLTLCTKTAEQLIKEIAELPKGAGTLAEIAEERLTREIQEYLNDGGDANARGLHKKTLLLAVTSNSLYGPNFTKAIASLLEAKANINAQDEHGITPLMNLAMTNKTVGIKQLLQDKTLDLFIQSQDGTNSSSTCSIFKKTRSTCFTQ